MSLLGEVVPPTQENVSRGNHWVASIHGNLRLKLLHEGRWGCASENAIHIHSKAPLAIIPRGHGHHVPLAVIQRHVAWHVPRHVVHEPTVRIQVRVRHLAVVKIVRVLHDGSDHTVGRMGDLRQENLNLVRLPWIFADVGRAVGEEVLKCVARASVVRHPKVDREWAVPAIVDVVEPDVIQTVLLTLEHRAEEFVLDPLHGLLHSARVLWLRPGLQRATGQWEVSLGYRKVHGGEGRVDSAFWGGHADAVAGGLGFERVLVKGRADHSFLLAAQWGDVTRPLNIDGARDGLAVLKLADERIQLFSLGTRPLLLQLLLLLLLLLQGSDDVGALEGLHVPWPAPLGAVWLQRANGGGQIGDALHEEGLALDGGENRSDHLRRQALIVDRQVRQLAVEVPLRSEVRPPAKEDVALHVHWAATIDVKVDRV
mmetsp:Transcript_11207/g.28403  ORF Transcript_11207/g.28403 Transcript_11207/m.28403 type:complete len:427 (-) Transcript_11207:172-1452(-)